MTCLTRRTAPGFGPVLIALVALSLAPAFADEPPSGTKMMMRVEAEAPRVDIPASEIVLPLLDWGNRPIVELTINGTGPHRFILDTGAMETVIDAGLVQEIGLREVGKQEIMSPAGDEPKIVSRVSMGNVTLDAIVIHDLKAASMDLAGMFKSAEAPRGVLSAQIFSGGLLAIDYLNDRIVVRPGELGPADGARIFQYDESDGFPTLPISVAGTEIKAHLDTGSPATFNLPGRYMESLPLKSEPVHRGTARTVDAEIKLYGAPLQGTLLVGEYTFEDPEIVFADRFPAGNLGYGFLRQFTLTLDLKNRRIRLDGEEGAVLAASGSSPAREIRTSGGAAGSPVVMKRMGPEGSSRKRYGVMFPGIDGTPLVVSGVEPGSPAESAGLRAGDIIHRMNDRRLADLDSQERIGMLQASPLALEVERDGTKLRIEMEL